MSSDDQSSPRGHWGRRVYEETVDHLIPWNAQGFEARLELMAGGIGLAVVVTATWILAAAGRISTAALIGWWVGWSVYEVIIRRHCKPWVKEGPWWGRTRRRASVIDLIAYVLTKNLLLGAGLFLLLRVSGLIP